MSATKRIASLLLILLMMNGCASAEDLIRPEDIAEESINYVTTKAYIGDFIQTKNSSVTECFPVTRDVYYEGLPAWFVRYNVNVGDNVSEGDRLATVYYDVDHAAIAKMELQLERLQEQLVEGILMRMEEIAKAEEEAQKRSNRYDRQIALLEVERMNLSMEQWIYEMESSIEDIRDDLVKMQEQYAETGIYATMDGVVDSLTFKRENDPLIEGEKIATIYNPEVILMYGEDSQGIYRYNMPTTVEMGPNKERVKTQGLVVVSDAVLPRELQSGKFYILADFSIGKRNNPNAHCEYMVIRNVVLADRKATENRNSETTVKMLGENGEPWTCVVNIGKTTPSYVWVLQGVSEDDLLIMD